LSSYKYAYRAGNKDSAPRNQDIAKGNWYLNYVDSLDNLPDKIHDAAPIVRGVLRDAIYGRDIQ
jgi:hypothetical protein